MRTHPKHCDCWACTGNRVKEYLNRIHDKSRLVPESPEQSVPVRAHWRRCPGHLKKMPHTRELLRAELVKLIKENK
jgi:hypothetical protein